MTKQCYYDVLGLDKTMPQEEVNKKGKKAMAMAHPDRGGSHEDFTAKNAAYSVLSNPEKRRVYDEGGFAALEELENGGGATRRGNAPTFQDLFEETFGKAGEGKPQDEHAQNLFRRARARRAGAGQRRTAAPRR